MCAKVAGRSKSRVKLNAPFPEVVSFWAWIWMREWVWVWRWVCAWFVHNNPLEASIKYEIQ